MWKEIQKGCGTIRWRFGCISNIQLHRTKSLFRKRFFECFIANIQQDADDDGCRDCWGARCDQHAVPVQEWSGQQQSEGRGSRIFSMGHIFIHKVRNKQIFQVSTSSESKPLGSKSAAKKLSKQQQNSERACSDQPSSSHGLATKAPLLPLLADLKDLDALRPLLRRSERGLNSTDNCHLGESYDEVNLDLKN